MFLKVLGEVSGRDVSSLRVLICGAAAVPAELIHQLNDRLGLERMINAYGLMEGTVVSMTRSGDPVSVIAGSTGRAVPGGSWRVVDDGGKDGPIRDRAAILLARYRASPGHCNDPEKTA